METDHRTYIRCYCGTSIVEQPFEEIWIVLMSILNHFEDMLANLAPSKFMINIRKIDFLFFKKGLRFDRSVQCPHCKEFSFMVIIIIYQYFEII